MTLYEEIRNELENELRARKEKERSDASIKKQNEETLRRMFAARLGCAEEKVILKLSNARIKDTTSEGTLTEWELNLKIEVETKETGKVEIPIKNLVVQSAGKGLHVGDVDSDDGFYINNEMGFVEWLSFKEIRQGISREIKDLVKMLQKPEPIRRIRLPDSV